MMRGRFIAILHFHLFHSQGNRSSFAKKSNCLISKTEDIIIFDNHDVNNWLNSGG